MDQAEKLRKMMSYKDEIKEEAKSIEKKAKVISISSGKGGVGKTNFAINFSISLKRLGYKVVIIDADIGLGNVEILTGVNLKNKISDIVFANKSIVEIMGDGPEGIKIISGGSGLKELSLLNNDNLPKLIKEIENLQSLVDYIIIDTGAGISPVVLDFIMASDEVIVVSTPDPTSIMDSYTLIKSLVTTGFIGKINIVSNLVDTINEGKEVFYKLDNACTNFLKIQVDYLGYIQRNDLVNYAVKSQTPFMISHPNHFISKRINIMTMGYLNLEDESNGSFNFAKKLLDIFKKR